MLNWCSYCQQFQGEGFPFEDFSITHGICDRCEPNADTLTKSDLAHALILKNLQGQLFEAGHRGDVKAAMQIIEDVGNANMRALDILIGIIAPMLYQIGQDWQQGTVSVAQEHRFTAFCEEMFDVIAAKVKTRIPAGDALQAERAEVLLMNAPGNCHTLGIRIVTLWLMDKGKQTRLVDVPATLEELAVQIGEAVPRLLLISMSLAEQTVDVAAIAQRIAAFPIPIRPRIIVGGHAVKLGLVPAIPGADLIADISSL